MRGLPEIDMTPETIGTLIGLAIFIPLLLWRMRKMVSEQPLKLSRLWIRPIYVLVVGSILLFSFPPALADIPWLALAAAIGPAWTPGP